MKFVHEKHEVVALFVHNIPAINSGVDLLDQVSYILTYKFRCITCINDEKV
jgi:hypothetical protein